jgi:hypothetical protein
MSPPKISMKIVRTKTVTMAKAPRKNCRKNPKNKEPMFVPYFCRSP